MIYIHIPFCRSFCTYCDFYSEVASRCRKTEDALRQEALFGEFAEAVAAEAVARGSEIRDDVNTLYIGGGTPSVLPLSAFRRMVDALNSLGHGACVRPDSIGRGAPVSSGSFGCGAVVGSDSIGCGEPVGSGSIGRRIPTVVPAGGSGKAFDEFTVEVNPEDIVEKGHAYVEGLLELGVNRISMGVQSFDDSVLRFMNRRHTAASAVQAYRILEEAGVRNISIDLIFGLPQLSLAQWKETLDKALSISSRGTLPQHISAYQLSVEPGSMLARMVEKGHWSEASEEVCQEQYAELCTALASAGYHHYEISNFALPGFEARHNSAYWSHIPYVGLGPGAHSFAVDRPSGVDGASFDGAGGIVGWPSGAGGVISDGAGGIVDWPSGADSGHFERSMESEQSFHRTWNRPDLRTYLAAYRQGDFSIIREGETLTEDQLTLERIMLGLRTSAGLPAAYLRTHCTPAALSRALSLGHLIPSDPHLTSDGSHLTSADPHWTPDASRLTSDGSRLRIPERHFFISDSIISALV